MTDSIKACLDCVHHKETGNYLLFHSCHNPAYQVEDPNYVTGEIGILHPYCFDARESSKLCGPEGAGWEQGEREPEQHPSLWSAFKGMLKELF